MAAYAVLLRGVNVGGHGKLPMATFRAVLEDLGHGDVKTYLQSGNAVLTSRASAVKVRDGIHAALAKEVGREVGVLVRTAAQLATIADGWPFDADAAPKGKHVVFLSSAADAKRLVAGLPLADLEPERLAVSGSEVYLSLPDGIGRSRLAELVAKRHKDTGATTRNWNTVTALRDLTAALA